MMNANNVFKADGFAALNSCAERLLLAVGKTCDWDGWRGIALASASAFAHDYNRIGLQFSPPHQVIVGTVTIMRVDV